MNITIYSRVLLTDGNEASIVEDFGDGYFIADIDKNGDTYTEEISLTDIQKILRY